MLPLWIAIAVAVSDQVVKHAVRDALSLGVPVPVIPGLLNLTYLRNTGAAWGLLRGQNSWLAVLSVTMLLTLVLFRKTLLNDSRSHQVALGCMIGGIAGNLLDRLRIGYVTDYLDVYIGSRHWPAFNIADAAICTGVGLYLLSSYLEDRRTRRGSAPGEPSGDSSA